MAHIRARRSGRSRLAYFRQLDRQRQRKTREPRDGGLVLPFGKHEGNRITMVPDGYLRWMVAHETLWCDAAARELARRARARRKESRR